MLSIIRNFKTVFELLRINKILNDLEIFEYSIGGSYALSLNGIFLNREIKDIDIIVKKGEIKRIKNNLNNYPNISLIKDYSSNIVIKIKDFKYEIDLITERQFKVDKIKIQSIDKILKYKKDFNRDKDKKDIEIIYSFLN